jgi:hypothetical protein
MNKKESPIGRVPNTSPEEEKLILESFKASLENQPFYKVEKEKTPEEKETIQKIIDFVPDFVEKYGGTPLKITPEIIHIIDESKLTAEQKQKLQAVGGGEEGGGEVFAWHDLEKWEIVIRPIESKLRNAEHFVHELMHMQSFKSLNLERSDNPTKQTFKREGKSLTTRRAGFGIFDKTNEKRYFLDIDEAIIEELTIRFDKEYFKYIPSLQEELRAREEARAILIEDNPELAADTVSVITTQLENNDREIKFYRYSYIEERKRLKTLIKEIYEKNEDQFPSEEEVFGVFVKTVFTGRLLEVARLIEKTFGKGSFRKLGEETMSEDAESEDLFEMK